MIRPTWMETFEQLHSATTAPELWGVLVSWHGIRSSSGWDEPFALFTRFHSDEASDAIVTAALLCTDYRWRKASHRLIHHIHDSGLLAAPLIDTLAEWFILDRFEIDATSSRDGAGSSAAPDAHRRHRTPSVAAPKHSATIVRPIWPPLRRWAAEHLVEREPARWRQLVAHADTLPSRDGAAVAAGVMDAASHIPTSDLRAAVTVGLASGSGIVRLAALHGLELLDGIDAALTTARSDASATVRAWTPRKTGSLSPLDKAPRSTASGLPEDDRGQPTLF